MIGSNRQASVGKEVMKFRVKRENQEIIGKFQRLFNTPVVRQARLSADCDSFQQSYRAVYYFQMPFD